MARFDTYARLAIHLSILIILHTTAISSSFNTFAGSLNNISKLDAEQEAPANKCYLATKCQPLASSACLDVTLPYKFTSLPTGFKDQQAVHEYLNKWKGLRKIPRCWIALQSVLCTSFLPRCDSNTTFLPTFEMCKIAQGPCRLIESHFSHIWPSFLRCDNKTRFPTNCSNQYKDLKFNISAAKCPVPLVPTDDSGRWFPEIDGCSYGCENSQYSMSERENITKFINYGAWCCVACSLFTIFTFLIDWKSTNRYPAVIIFYLCVCVCISSSAWLMQFFVAEKNAIVCRLDKTIRKEEPSSPDNFLCLANFVVIYYFLMAALVWFANLAFAWDMSFRRTAFRKNDKSKEATYFHLTAWSIPLMLTITVLAVGEVCYAASQLA